MYTAMMARALRWLFVVFASFGLTAHADGPPSTAVRSTFDPHDWKVDGAPATHLLVVHYHRVDEKYTDWNVWAWPEHGEGRAYAFDQRDAFGSTAVVPFKEFPPRIGFLLRRGEWVEKDIDQDRFVTTTKGAKVLEIWLQSGIPEIRFDANAATPAFTIDHAFLDG
ncbi:MAG: hypothetical protein DWI11_04290, partial [Planctomycetota bacterium]